MNFEELKESKQYKLQQELFGIIKEKIGTKDREKSRLFLSKLRELAESNEMQIDPMIMEKVENLLRHKQEIDD